MSEKTQAVTYGQVAYEAYCGKSGWKSLISGADLPPWGELSADIREAWRDGGNAVSDVIHGDGTAMAESRQLRELVAEILAAFGPSGSGHTARVGQVQIGKWRQRAGIEAGQ